MLKFFTSISIVRRPPRETRQDTPLPSSGSVTVNVVPLPSFGLHFDSSAVSPNDVLAHRQAESDAFGVFFGGEERLEDLGEDVRLVSPIRRPELRSRPLRISPQPGSDPEVSSMWHGIEGVHRQSKHDLFDLPGIALHARQLRGQIGCNSTFFISIWRRNELDAPVHHGV